MIDLEANISIIYVGSFSGSTPPTVRICIRIHVPWNHKFGSSYFHGFIFFKLQLFPLHFLQTVKQVVWHAKGDYFATLLSDGT